MADSDKQPVLEPRVATEVVTQVLRLAHRLRALLSDHFSEFGLTDIRSAALQAIREHSNEGCSQTELAQHLEQSESSVSMLIDRMRASGLVYRLRSKTDRRKRVLMLTDRGRQLLEQLDACHDARMSDLLNSFTPFELQTLSALLKRVNDRVADLPPSIHSVTEDAAHTDEHREPEKPAA